MKILNMFIMILYFLLPSAGNTQNVHSTKYDNSSSSGLAYVCHITQYYVTVIDTKTNQTVGKINCSKGPNYICFSSDGKYGYIANFDSNNITVFDKSSSNIISTAEAGVHPETILPVQGGKYLVVSHESNDGNWIISTSDYSVFKKMDEGTGHLYFYEPGNKIYQPQIFTPSLFIIDPNTFEITKKVEIGGRPMDMTIVDNKYGYIGNFDFNEITKVDLKSDEVISHIKNVNYPRGITSTSDGKYLYVNNVIENKVNVISTDTDQLIATIDGFKMPVSISISADNKYAYVSNQGAGTISVVDTDSKTIVNTINVADNPIYVYIDK